jgi:hypothetical protein
VFGIRQVSYIYIKGYNLEQYVLYLQ